MTLDACAVSLAPHTPLSATHPLAGWGAAGGFAAHQRQEAHGGVRDGGRRASGRVHRRRQGPQPVRGGGRGGVASRVASPPPPCSAFEEDVVAVRLLSEATWQPRKGRGAAGDDDGMGSPAAAPRCVVHPHAPQDHRCATASHPPPPPRRPRRERVAVTLPAAGAAADADSETALAAAEAARVSAALWQPQVPVGVTAEGVAYPAHRTGAPAATAAAGGDASAGAGAGAAWAATPSSAHGMAVAGAGGDAAKRAAEEGGMPGDVAAAMRSVEYARAIAAAAAGCKRGESARASAAPHV
jgi:hypothetical protein